MFLRRRSCFSRVSKGNRLLLVELLIGSCLFLGLNWKRGRAMGESGLPGELFALALAQMASMFFSLLLKATIYVQEPFQVKGSQLCTFYKGRGAQTVVASQRGINLSEDAGKAFHHAIANKVHAAAAFL